MQQHPDDTEERDVGMAPLTNEGLVCCAYLGVVVYGDGDDAGRRGLVSRGVKLRHIRMPQRLPRRYALCWIELHAADRGSG